MESKYDTDYKPTKKDIEKYPDLQNGQHSLIKGAKVAIHQVGIHNFRIPLKYKRRNGNDIELETRVTGTVSLEAHKKGINSIIQPGGSIKDNLSIEYCDNNNIAMVFTGVRHFKH